MKIRSTLERLQLPQKKNPRLFMRSFKGHDNPGCRITEVFQEKNK